MVGEVAAAYAFPPCAWAGRRDKMKADPHGVTPFYAPDEAVAYPEIIPVAWL